jgi:hypothetical protein
MVPLCVQRPSFGEPKSPREFRGSATIPSLIWLKNNSPLGEIVVGSAPICGWSENRAMMKQEDAKREILAKWNKLPWQMRQTENDAARFAFSIKDKYKFRCGTEDPYQTIKAWLTHDIMSLRRGLD